MKGQDVTVSPFLQVFAVLSCASVLLIVAATLLFGWQIGVLSWVVLSLGIGALGGVIHERNPDRESQHE